MSAIIVNGHNSHAHVLEQPDADQRAAAPALALSPARQALKEHHGWIRKLSEDAECASVPVARLREQLANANQELAAAEAALASVEGEYAAAIAEAARSPTTAPLPKPPAARAKLVGQADDARRNKAALEQAMAACLPDYTAATTALRDAQTGTGALVVAVLLEVERSAVFRWRLARDLYIAAEAEVRGLHSAMSDHGRALESQTKGGGLLWFRALESANAAWSEEAVKDVDHRAAAERWAALLRRLHTDATAK